MQSRFMSLVEAVTNIVVGYGLAVLTQIIVFPFFGLHATLSENLLIGVLFTAISLVRSYVLRRLFNGSRPGRHGRTAASGSAVPS
jgi:hypothetical protein